MDLVLANLGVLEDTLNWRHAFSEEINATPRKGMRANGMGIDLLSGAASTLKILGPLALKAFIPIGL